MRVLITGGAGFIGSHLADSLLREGHEVAVIDNLSTGSEENIAHLLAHPGFTFHHDTIFHLELIASLIGRCDIVYHLAAAVGVKRIIQAPVETIETNVAGSELVLRLAARHKRRIVLASTSEVYGKSTQLPFLEDGDLVLGATSQSRWSYACSKAIDEFLALAWHRQSGLPVTIARLFNTVGTRQSSRYGMVLPTFVGQALREPAYYRLRQRTADALLYPRCRYRRRPHRNRPSRRRHRRNLQPRQHLGDFHRPTGATGAGGHRLAQPHRPRALRAGLRTGL